MHRFLLPAVCLLAACGQSPVGDWIGVLTFNGDNGQSFTNSMSVDKDGASVQLYVLLDNPDFGEPDEPEFLIGDSDFTATWTDDKDDVTFSLSCLWTDCDYNPTMVCTFDDPGMICDMTPDYYADDREALQWIEL
ncbi:MAG: hypothetical protein AB8H79_17295 [Myxococcota bacterium]